MDWLNGTPFWIALLVLAVTGGLGVFLAWLSMTARLLRWRDRLRSRIPARLSERKQRMVLWGIYAVASLTFWPMVFLMLSVVVAFAIAPPYLAAKADAERDWKAKTYEHWDQAAWTSSTGEKRTGYVYSCSDHECAILDGSGQAYVVAREQVGERKGGNR